MSEDDVKYLKLTASALREAYREKTEVYGVDSYTEGAKWIKVSDELANQIAERLEKITEDMCKIGGGWFK